MGKKHIIVICSASFALLVTLLLIVLYFMNSNYLIIQSAYQGYELGYEDVDLSNEYLLSSDMRDITEPGITSELKDSSNYDYDEKTQVVKNVYLGKYNAEAILGNSHEDILISITDTIEPKFLDQSSITIPLGVELVDIGANISIRDMDGKLYLTICSETYNPKEKGTYTAKVLAKDSSSNYSIRDYEITVDAKAKAFNKQDTSTILSSVDTYAEFDKLVQEAESDRERVSEREYKIIQETLGDEAEDYVKTENERRQKFRNVVDTDDAPVQPNTLKEDKKKSTKGDKKEDKREDKKEDNSEDKKKSSEVPPEKVDETQIPSKTQQNSQKTDTTGTIAEHACVATKPEGVNGEYVFASMEEAEQYRQEQDAKALEASGKSYWACEKFVPTRTITDSCKNTYIAGYFVPEDARSDIYDLFYAYGGTNDELPLFIQQHKETGMFYLKSCYQTRNSTGCYGSPKDKVSKSTIIENIEESMAKTKHSYYYRRITEATFNYFWEKFIESNFGTKYEIVFIPEGNGTDYGELRLYDRQK